MLKRFLTLLTLAMIAMPLSVVAQKAGDLTGRYATYTVSQDVAELPSGEAVIMSHYNQSIFASTPGHALDNNMANCVGLTRLNTDGSVSSASGSCYTTDADGDGASYWWRMEKAGTTDCPRMCGAWGYFDGYGKFKGLRGNGTWVQKSVFAEGSSGTWAVSYTMP